MERDLAARTIALEQHALIDRIVAEYAPDASPVSTPMRSDARLHKPDPNERLTPTERSTLDALPYRPLVGSLQYLLAGTRPDLAYTISVLSSFMNCYRAEHWNAAIWTVRYLKGTRNLRLILGGATPMRLVGYTDASFADCPDTRRSTGGYATFLNAGSGPISWASRKQLDTADSTCVSEYIAAHDAAKELVWLRTLLSELQLTPVGPTPLYCDNSAAVTLAGDQAFHKKVKHVAVRYHYLRELVQRQQIVVQHVAGKSNVADIFTKPLGPGLFERCRYMLGLR